MDGEITLTGVRATGYHGVLEEERRNGQEFTVDVLASLPFPAVDELTGTVNYAEMAQLIHDLVSGQPRQLIETLAAEIAGSLLSTFLPLSQVQVTVHKPDAPIPVPFGDVAVTVHRSRRYRAVLSLGSNMALAARTPRDILARAIDRLGTRCAVHAVSPLYETDAWGNTDQPNFNNCVVICETNLAPERLLDAVQQVEHEFHRIRTIHWGPRTLDVDIANLYDAATGQEIPVHTDRLTVPHPCAHERDFVLVPWADVAPDDLLGAVPVRDLLAAPTPGVRLVAEEWR